jgi:hypothetical protein
LIGPFRVTPQEVEIQGSEDQCARGEQSRAIDTVRRKAWARPYPGVSDAWGAATGMCQPYSAMHG